MHSLAGGFVLLLALFFRAIDGGIIWVNVNTKCYLLLVIYTLQGVVGLLAKPLTVVVYNNLNLMTVVDFIRCEFNVGYDCVFIRIGLD